jgi:predicted O-methyltransferase YrrM
MGDLSPVLISTILLNWNRSVLLEQTLRSYAETVTGPFELFVIDNGSSDDSRAVIEDARKYIADLQVLSLDENIGGEAYNLCLDRISGALVHLSENDYVYLEGWAEHVRDAFRCFPDLGQLSLSNGIRRDNQPGSVLPADLRFAHGTILYQARGNVVTTSVLRSLLFQKHEIRVRNYPWCNPEQMLLPDDRQLSADVKHAGYWCALSDRNYTRNLGHEIEEFERDPDYYFKNYSSKPWLGVDGWQKRNAELTTRLIPTRLSTVFPDAALQPERTIRDVAGKSAQLWSMFDAWTAESEVLDFLYALVHMVKPRSVIETGTWLGRAAIAIAAALRDNGFGQVASIELNVEAAATARQNIEAAGLTTFVSLHVGSVLDFEPACRYDFTFFDSSVPNEFDRFHPYLEVGSTLLFQNISRAQGGGADTIQALIHAGILHGISFDTPRGLFVGKLLKSKAVSAR